MEPDLCTCISFLRMPFHGSICGQRRMTPARSLPLAASARREAGVAWIKLGSGHIDEAICVPAEHFDFVWKG